MRLGIRTIGLVVILLAPMGAHAGLIDIDDYSRRTGYRAGIEHESLRYDADLQWLTYSSSSRFQYSDAWGACGFQCETVRTDFDGMFVWGAGVNAHGDVVNPGAMTWLGNLGNGYEVLATGSLAQIGSAMFSVMPSTMYGPIYIDLNLQFLFDLTYLDHRVSGMGDQMLLLFEQKLERLTPQPFAQSFDCPITSADPPFPACARWSTSGLMGMVAVPEPGTFSLLLTGLMGLIVPGARLASAGFGARGRT